MIFVEGGLPLWYIVILAKKIAMNKQNAALLSVISNSILIVFKIAAGMLMGSISVISEAVHSALDLLASLVAWFSIKKAVEPADQEHPFGHGKFENISGFFEAMLIAFAAGMIVYEAVKKLFHPVQVERIDWGIGVMIVSIIINLLISQALFRTAKKSKSIALEADGMHLFVDFLTSLSVLAALITIKFTHWTILDPVIAMVVAIMIGKASVDLMKKSIHDLADRSLPEGELQSIRQILQGDPQILGYHKLRTRQSGNQREIDIHITMDKNITLKHSHDLSSQIETKIKEVLPGTYITLHVEPEEDKSSL
jgi:cation diffusion facilitator family transporter